MGIFATRHNRGINGNLPEASGGVGALIAVVASRPKGRLSHQQPLKKTEAKASAGIESFSFI